MSVGDEKSTLLRQRGRVRERERKKARRGKGERLGGKGRVTRE